MTPAPTALPPEPDIIYDRSALKSEVIAAYHEYATKLRAAASALLADNQRLREWAAYAQKRYHDETGGDLQAQGQ